MAFTNAHIIPVEGPEVQRGTLLVQNGKILAVGASVEVPKDALVQDCSNQVIMHGLICTHSHIGGWGGADRSGPIQPDARIIEQLVIWLSVFTERFTGFMHSYLYRHGGSS